MICTVTSTIAPLYFEKDTNAVLQDEVLYGMSAAVLHDEGDWLCIETTYRYRGYIEKKHAVLSNYAPDTVIAANFADVMSEPKVNSINIACIPKGGFIRSLHKEESNFTLVITPDGKEGFIRSDALAPIISKRTANENEFRKAVVKTGWSYFGTPYRWGGKTPQGIDCSGFCSMCYMLNGELIHRDASIKDEFAVRSIPFSEAKAGDLLFFPGHVALYIGNLRFLHATAHAGDGKVVENSLDPNDPLFREDLLKSMTNVGSIFRSEE